MIALIAAHITRCFYLFELADIDGAGKGDLKGKVASNK